MTALYELTTEYRTALAVLDNSDLDPETIRDTLEGLQFPVEEKSKNVAMFVKNIEATARAIREAEGQMAQRRKRLEQKIDSITEYLKTNMEACGITKIDSPFLTLTIKRNPASVVVDNPDLIPAEFLRTPPVVSVPDKKLIGDRLKSGDFVPGAHLQTGTRLEIK
jgi:hypothetical protein